MRQIETPLGMLQVSLLGASEPGEAGSVNCRMDVVPIKPSLPSGMSVSGCVAAIVFVEPREALRNIRFHARLLKSQIFEASPETGEGLEAQSFRTASHVLLVGTEDAEFLQARLRESVTLPEAPFTYTNDSIALEISEVRTGKEISLHLLMAWNELPEPQECSCWYAVDQSHSALLLALGANTSLQPRRP